MASASTGMDPFPDEETLALLAEQIAALPAADLLCPFCVVPRAEPWPEFADERLCAAHLPVFRALVCTGWNADRWHQHLAALARWGKLPRPIDWWPQGGAGAPPREQ